MTDIRSEIHEEVDRMTEKELVGLKEFLTTFPSRLGAIFRNAPWDDEPFAEEERLAVEEAEEWLKQNGGRGIPHDQVCRTLGLGRYRARDDGRVDAESNRRSGEANPA